MYLSAFFCIFADEKFDKIMGYKKPLLIGDVLSQVIRQSVGQKTADGLDAAIVQRKWHEVLGPVMSRYSFDERYEVSSGVFTVRIQSSVLRHELFLQRKELIKRLNDALGRNLVLALVLR